MAFAEALVIRIPLDQRRHYLACMQELKQHLAEQPGVTRFLVLEDRERLGQFLEIIEYESGEAHTALAASEPFTRRLREIDGKVEALAPGLGRDRRPMHDRL
jgi:quinol monooxygenase YgiN